ncbi:hypothetical protein [Desulfurococcus mucosus]|uniref:Uncharacterized protein n=1 Tax=Desulfurococcus mucosus (strain ATCC 35584 / DSM 2162 / JCM 9187 / O7/1) TaxID=765177 RepID=E8R750_DESM0|nr:hypothetical protein [Desulfurococcus mucosus]ADV65515.1 hypothetical protein Desmu_1219 [Desulfurococcus mucosus DSM 2162]
MEGSLSVLVDVLCEPGRLAKLEKHLRSMGFATRILSPDTLRVVQRMRLRDPGDALSMLFNALKSSSMLTRRICVEAWVLLPSEAVAGDTVLNTGSGFLYVRKGRRGMAVVKVVWGSVNPYVKPPPGSAMRKCVEPTGLQGLEEELRGRLADIASLPGAAAPRG